MKAGNLKAVKPHTLPSVPLNNKQNLPNVSCIYFVMDGETVVYVGKTIALYERWRQHHRYENFKQIPDARIAWLEVSDRSQLLEIERAAIANFQPSLNQIPNNRQYADKLKHRNSERRVAHLSDKPSKKLFCRLAVLMAQKNLQLSQSQLARETNLDVTTINRLFTNKFRRIDLSTVMALHSYFGCSVGDLFEMRNPEDIPQRKVRKSRILNK